MNNQQNRRKAGQRGGLHGLGNRRYERYVAAFDRVEHCLEAKCYLEAIAILDSLISDRLTSRLGFLQDQEISGGLPCGQLCRKLVGAANDPTRPGLEEKDGFRRVTQDIQRWVDERNKAMHQTAKILREDESEATFDQLLERHREDVVRGRELLRQFDELDTADRREDRTRLPASWPNAFFPERREAEAARRLVSE